MTREITRLVANSQVVRAAVRHWRNELPDASINAVDALNKIRQETAAALDAKADQWRSENKLIHEGAARALANELKQRIA